MATLGGRAPGGSYHRAVRTPRSAWRRHLTGPAPPWVAPVLRGLACALAAALIALPVAVERAVEQVRFSDHLGTFPVDVGLCHDGRSTLDTGLFGKMFWGQTGAYGFGAFARATGPPEAGDALASYVEPEVHPGERRPDRRSRPHGRRVRGGAVVRPARAPAARRAAGGRTRRCAAVRAGAARAMGRRLASRAARDDGGAGRRRDGAVRRRGRSAVRRLGLQRAFGHRVHHPRCRPPVVREPRDPRDRLAGRAVHRQEHPADRDRGPRLRGRSHGGQLHLGPGPPGRGPAGPHRRTPGDRRGRPAGQLRGRPRAHGPVRRAGRVARPRRRSHCAPSPATWRAFQRDRGRGGLHQGGVEGRGRCPGGRGRRRPRLDQRLATDGRRRHRAARPRHHRRGRATGLGHP